MVHSLLFLIMQNADILNAIKNSIDRERIKDLTYGGGTAGKKIAEIISTAPLDFKKILQY